MKLISLELREWRAYEHEFIEFPDGLVGVAGPNGAGKSTIAEAVGWTLFGRLRRGVKQTTLRRQGGNGRPLAELKFRMGDAMYTVRRVAGGECSLWLGDGDGDPEASGSRNVNAKISRELDLSWDVFRRTVFAEQKDIAALDPGMTGPDRRAHVERLLGLTRFKIAAESARRDAKQLATEITGRLAQVADPQELEAALLDAESLAEAESPAVAKAKNEFETAETNYKTARDKARAEQSRVTAAVAADGRRDKAAGLAAVAAVNVADAETLITERDQRSTQLAKVWGDAAQAPQAEKRAEDWQKLCDAEEAVRVSSAAVNELGYDEDVGQAEAEALERFEEERKVLDSTRAGLKQEVALIRQRIDALDEAKAAGKVGPLQEKVKVMTKKHAESRKRLDVLRARLEDDVTHVVAVEKGGPSTPCPVCKKPYGDEHEAILDSYRERIAALEAELPELATEVETVEAELEAQREALERSKTAQRELDRADGPATLSGATTALERAEQKLREASERIEVVDDELPSVRKRVKEAGALGRKWSAKQEIAGDRQAQREQALKALGVDSYEPGPHRAAQKEAERLRKIRDEADDLRRRVADAIGLEKRLETAKEQLREQRAAEAAALEELQELGVEGGDVAALREGGEALQEACQLAESRRDELRIAYEAAREEARNRNEEVKRIKRDLRLAKQAHDEIAGKQAEQKRHQDGAEILEAFRAHEAKRAWPRLETGAAELLSAATDGRYSDLRLSENDFQITVSDRGEFHGLARLSGGEQDLANLCLRLAIAEWVANERGVDLSLLILDEVFGSLDDERKPRLLDQLRNLSKRFGQMLIITHVPEIAEMCDSRIDVSLKDVGRSQAVVAP